MARGKSNKARQSIQYENKFPMKQNKKKPCAKLFFHADGVLQAVPNSPVQLVDTKIVTRSQIIVSTIGVMLERKTACSMALLVQARWHSKLSMLCDMSHL